MQAVRGVDFDVARGEIVGLVGESGSGKSSTALALLGLVPARGTIRLDQTDVLATAPTVRGRRIAMLFQEPATTFNPVLPIGDQLAEPAILHLALRRDAARARAAALLARVGVPTDRMDAFPHQLSGGQLQRIGLAMALICDPQCLVADEPTAALDVQTQGQILALVKDIQRERDLAVLWITHDLTVAGQICDRILVMYGGRIVEGGPSRAVLEAPAHPYSQALLACVPARTARDRTIPRIPPGPVADRGCAFAPRCPFAEPACAEQDLPMESFRGRGVRCRRVAEELAAPPSAPRPVAVVGPTWVEVRRLGVTFPRRRTVLEDVSFEIRKGEVLGLVGASGAGKSTVGLALANLLSFVHPQARIDGEVRVDGRPIGEIPRTRIQVVFQDPLGSLNPRMRVRRILGDRARELMEQVGLGPEILERFPHELSGGQRQRVAIARALAPRPDLLIADEPFSALDVSVQAEILDLLLGLRERLGLSIVLITHDLGVVEYAADRVVALAHGRIAVPSDD